MQIVDSFEHKNKTAIYLDTDETEVAAIRKASKININGEIFSIIEKDFMTSLIGKTNVALLLNTSKSIKKGQNIRIIN